MTVISRQPSIAVVKGAEDYDTISTAFAATFQEIDGLQQLGFVAVNGVSYNIELFFSSDMKVCDVMVLQACTFMFRMCYSSCSQCWALMQLTPLCMSKMYSAP